MSDHKKFITYLCTTKQFEDAYNACKNQEDNERFTDLLIRYGNIDDIAKYYKHLNNFMLSANTSIYIASDRAKIEFAFRERILSEGSVYSLIGFNYTYISLIGDIDINPCKVIFKSRVSFIWIIEEFIKIGWTYEEILKYRYNDEYMLAIILDKVDANDIIKFMDMLFNLDKNLFIKFMRISDDYSVLSINDDSELREKIIKYIRGRKMLDKVIESDPYLQKIKLYVKI